MSTVSGFSPRPADPIWADQLATKISADIGKTVTVEVSPTDVFVTGATISGADKSAIQTSMNSYVYVPPNLGNIMVGDSDATLTANSNSRLSTEKAVKTYIDTRMDTKGAWINGSWKPNAVPFYASASTSGGTAVFWLTDTGGSGGNAVFANNVYSATINSGPFGQNASYQLYNPVISGDKKSITVNVTQTTTVLVGLLQFTNASNGVDIRLIVLGD